MSNDLWREAIFDLSEIFIGLAVYALPHLLMAKLLSQEEKDDIEKCDGVFSLDKGQKLAHFLAKRDPSDVLHFLIQQKNAFVVTSLTAAIQGRWSVDKASFGVPELPPHVTDRPEVLTLAWDTLVKAFQSSEQCWLGFFGREGTGKTVLATQLAKKINEKSNVVWLSFHERPQKDILDDALQQMSVYLLGEQGCNAEEYFQKEVTCEKFKDVVLFVDDVCRCEDLFPFLGAKTVVFSSRKQVDNIGCNLNTFQVPLSLTVDESEKIFRKVIGESLSSVKEFLTVLEKVALNPKKTATLASTFRNVEKSNFVRFQEQISQVFEDDEDHYPDEPEILSQHGQCLKKIFIDMLSDERKVDFDRLIIFPKGELITSLRFAVFYDNSKDCAESRLEFLKEKSILEKRHDGFVINKLWSDFLRERVSDEERRRHISDFCDGCERLWSDLDWTDKFVLKLLPPMCINSSRKDHALQLLSSVQFLFERSARLERGGEFNVRDLLSLRSLGVEIDRVDQMVSLAVEFCDWMIFERSHLARQAVLYALEANYAEILKLASAQAVLPLFRCDRLTEVEKDLRISETSQRGKTAFKVHFPFDYQFRIFEEEVMGVPFNDLLPCTLNLHFPCSELNWDCIAAWIPALNDFAMFFSDLRIERSNGKVLVEVDIPHWDSSGTFEVRACGNRAAVWNDRSYLLFSFRSDTGEFLSEHTLAQNDKQKIRDVFPMAFGTAILLSDFTFELRNGDVCHQVVKCVQSVSVSSEKLVLYIKNSGIHVMEEGGSLSLLTEVKKLGRVYKVSCLAGERILAWGLDNALLLSQEGEVIQLVENFPSDVLNAVAYDNNLVFVISDKSCWLYDFEKEKREEVVIAQRATMREHVCFCNVVCSLQRVFFQCREWKWLESRCRCRSACFSIHRLDLNTS